MPEAPEELQAQRLPLQASRPQNRCYCWGLPPSDSPSPAQPSVCCALPSRPVQARLSKVSLEQGQFSCVKRILSQRIFRGRDESGGFNVPVSLSLCACCRRRLVPWVRLQLLQDPTIAAVLSGSSSLPPTSLSSRCCCICRLVSRVGLRILWVPAPAASLVKVLRFASGFYELPRQLQPMSRSSSLPQASLNLGPDAVFLQGLGITTDGF